jgi:glycosyltransferase involved in cell wall biosynthesis
VIRTTGSRSVAFVGRRLGARDGISAASAVWQRAFEQLGWSVTTIAGAGEVDHRIPGLDPVDGRAGCLDTDPTSRRLEDLLADHDLVVAENLAAMGALSSVLAGRPAIIRHHDLPWQASGGFATVRGAMAASFPDDRAWRHVTINERSRIELAARGVDAVAVYNRFAMNPVPGRRDLTRAAVGLADGDRLLLQPTRGAAPKNVAGGLRLAAGVQATYWLFGPIEASYAPLVEQLVGRTPVRVILGRGDGVTLADAYAASDAVVLPSTWEGFGNAAIEAAIHLRPFSVGAYPVATELRRYGFSWFDAHDPAPLARHLATPDPFVVERNEQVARVRFSADELPETLTDLLTPR